MRSGSKHKGWGLLGLAVPAVLIFGCGGEELSSPTALRLRGLSTVFLDYAVAKGHGPKDEQALCKHLQNLPDFILEMNHIDAKNIDAMFLSPRDQQPFVIHYGVSISLGGPNTPMVAHEKTGENGKRLVAFANGEVELVNEDRFQELTKAQP